MNIIPTPGLLTVTAQDFNRCTLLRQHGYEHLAFQAQNDANLIDHDLTSAKSAGLYAGVWGVSYRIADFHRDGQALAQQAKKLGATHLTMDVEQAAKGTRSGRGLKPVVDGCRAGGWTGPIHLNTMGPPVNPDVNDYEIDVQSFLETGGGVFTQAYANETDSFTPELGVRYWTRVGVPRDRLNIQVSLYAAESDKEHPGRRYDGAKWSELLSAAGVAREFSVFMAEAAKDEDLAGLDPHSMRAPIPPGVDVAANRVTELALAQETVDHWRRNGMPEAKLQRQRQTLAWRVLQVTQTAANLDAIKADLDAAGAPKP